MALNATLGASDANSHVDIIGQTFNNLKVLSCGKDKRNRTVYKCLCKCGAIHYTGKWELVNGHTKSCGKDICHVSYKHGMAGTPIAKVYKSMIQRCYNSNFSQFKDYGGRGITVCSEWRNSPEKFYLWAFENGFDLKLRIDRENNDKGYSPFNCRFVSIYVSAANRRKQLNNKSGFIGVFKTTSNKFWAKLTYKKIVYDLGVFESAKEAATVRDLFIIKNKYPHTLNGGLI